MPVPYLYVHKFRGYVDVKDVTTYSYNSKTISENVTRKCVFMDCLSLWLTIISINECLRDIRMYDMIVCILLSCSSVEAIYTTHDKKEISVLGFTLIYSLEVADSTGAQSNVLAKLAPKIIFACSLSFTAPLEYWNYQTLSWSILEGHY